MGNITENHKLFNALAENNTDGVKEAINNGADIFHSMLPTELDFVVKPLQINNALEMAIFCAGRHSNYEVVVYLKDKGIPMERELKKVLGNPNTIINEGSTTTFRFLQLYYPDLYGPRNEHFSVHNIVNAGKSDKLRIMKEMGYNLDEKDENGRTPLMCSANFACSSILIKSGADILARDIHGKTPTWYIAQKFYSDAIQNGCGGDTCYVSMTQTYNLIAAAKNPGLEQDGNAEDIADMLRELLKKNLLIDARPAYQNPDFLDIIKQVRTIEARVLYEKLYDVRESSKNSAVGSKSGQKIPKM